MKKTLIGLALALLLVGVVGGQLSYSALKQQHVWRELGETSAAEQTDLAETADVTLYHGERRYIVVQGVTQQGEQKIVWFREDGMLEHVERMADLIPAEQIERALMREEAELTRLRLQAGLEERKPIWEAIYLDAQGKYHYAYFDMKTGQLLRAFSLKQVR
ncbi:hypothetical protein BEP19_02095 [Ammoniphilus oxalaticus]|uniref:Cell wall elongation regulator TseB-like domain-containing protein n=1 Tax=Ammoniphilus oxalaticus TaxID=66863 RepID=A0A419SN82_9BACL|nr:DUF5590 domain-containing protein [Ammoniphilus oxalaticus]RKD25756.1 hypothetical protein BEP19_02095 [Ammoniphilus oxalaticus]